jgi:hypothetical protein
MKLSLVSFASIALVMASGAIAGIADVNVRKAFNMNSDLKCPSLDTIPAFGEVQEKIYTKDDDRVFQFKKDKYNQAMKAKITEDGMIAVEWNTLKQGKVKNVMIKFASGEKEQQRELEIDATNFAMKISDLDLEPKIWNTAMGIRRKKLRVSILDQERDRVLAEVDVPNIDILSYIYKRFLGEKEKCDDQVQKDVNKHFFSFFERPSNDK